MKKEEKVVIGIVFYILTALMSPSAGASETISTRDFKNMLKDCDKTNDMLKKGEYELDYLECLTLKHGVSEKVAEQMLK